MTTSLNVTHLPALKSSENLTAGALSLSIFPWNCFLHTFEVIPSKKKTPLQLKVWNWMWGIQQAWFWKEDENTHITEGYLVGRRENYRGVTGKLISAQPQWFRHRARLLWTLEGAKVGTGAWHFFHCGCLLDWTACSWEEAWSKIQQKVHERLISRRCETMPEINSYSACVRLINHLDTFGIWAKRGNQLLAWVLILTFQ